MRAIFKWMLSSMNASDSYNVKYLMYRHDAIMVDVTELIGIEIHSVLCDLFKQKSPSPASMRVAFI